MNALFNPPWKILLGFYSLLIAALSAPGAITLASPFTDHAVLQCDKPIPIWGRADPGESISVSFGGQSAQTVAGREGRWHVELKPLAATAVPAELVVRGKNTVVLQDVVVGEVWLASGQSNMEWPVNLTHDAAREMAAANFPLIRHLKIEHVSGPAPVEFAKTNGWQVAAPETVGGFTAVGYFFARELHRQLNVPVGIVHSSWGGTEIESWMSDKARRATPSAAEIDARWKKSVSEWPPERIARYPADMAAWQKAEAEAKATQTRNPLPWPQPPATNDSPALPGGPYNAMIAPLQPFALRGFLWYQGESNVQRAQEYSALFTALIQNWRTSWGDKRLPFYFVQLPNYAAEDANGTAWPALREAQARVLALAETGMAVAIDGEEAQNLHPTKKQEIGRRLALIALARTYHRTVEWTGPQFTRAVREGSAMRLSVQSAGALTLRSHEGISFEIAGADKVFHPATAKVDGATLSVSSSEVSDPVAVRYAWRNAPAATLFNSAGLPAAPFRSDSW
jgi:sialate O-acetylesterase